jgi:uncharacterized protein Usg
LTIFEPALHLLCFVWISYMICVRALFIREFYSFWKARLKGEFLYLFSRKLNKNSVLPDYFYPRFVFNGTYDFIYNPYIN